MLSAHFVNWCGVGGSDCLPGVTWEAQTRTWGEILPNSCLVCCTFCSVMFSAWVSLSHLPSYSHVSDQCPTSLSLLLIHDAWDCLDWCSVHLPTYFASGLLIWICLPTLGLTPMLTPGCLNRLLVLYIYGCIFGFCSIFSCVFVYLLPVSWLHLQTVGYIQ